MKVFKCENCKSEMLLENFEPCLMCGSEAFHDFVGPTKPKVEEEIKHDE